ncbi:MAG: hypothetical protein K9I55_06260, partial [Haliscomenobacter sp.]|nr:hypothetical protein [Haliscomenobacter sp.]
QVKAGEYYIGTCRGKVARHRVSTNMEIMKILIQSQVKAGEYYIGTCRGKDDVLRWQLTFKLF